MSFTDVSKEVIRIEEKRDVKSFVFFPKKVIIEVQVMRLLDGQLVLKELLLLLVGLAGEIPTLRLHKS